VGESIPIPALILCFLFVSLAGIHIFWAFSQRTGPGGVTPTENGEPVFRPGRVATLAVAAILAAAAGVTLWRGAWPDAGASWIPRTGIVVIALVFSARAVGDFRHVGFFKRVRGTRFARNDTLVFSPLCIAISALALWLALGY
jgi:hypothetical protein